VTETPDDAKAAEKALRKLEIQRGVLDPADRYDAQIDAVKFAQDLIELGDRKARFALVIMSVLNAIAVLIAVRGGAGLVPTSGAWAMLLAVELAAYAIVTAYYISQAISALRPRGVEPPRASDLPSQVTPGISMRVLFHADVVARDRAAYRALWDGLRQDNLTTELADQLHTLAGINQDKFAALDRLYFGLGVMTGLLATVLATLAAYHLLT
jgi:hypothetical protein